jgi:siroheme synthase-like protein
VGFYPIFVELRDRPCVVIGGGAIAERKVEGLRAAGAGVTVVAPNLTLVLRAMAEAGEIRHLARRYRAGDLAGASLALVAVQDPTVSAMVRAEARGRRIWLNAADDPERCDFILPAVLRRGSLAIAVATGGESPALSRVLRDWLEAELPADLAALASAAASVRRALRAARRAPSSAAWCTALEGEIRARLSRALAAAP